MNPCHGCGAEAPQGARFCPACGARLEAQREAVTERRVVSVLFADLVGYTALSERSDPEDVDRLLRAFYEAARSTIERFGGSVEKYIGDAVVGLFGAPVAHEDDAERAVRAGLEIVAGMPDLPRLAGERMEVRVGVNTGRALVRLELPPGSDEARLVGDTVNTASRLLAGAPPQGVACGALTHRLTERAIFYEELRPAKVKGKTEPVSRWLAIAPVARLGIDPRPRAATPLVGREVELATLDGLLARAAASRTPQFVLVTGEAGIGKSRLVQEFFRLLDSRPGFCLWRQGRCPPYGDELAYWSLREIVAAHAGILQTDDSAVVGEKLARAVADAGDHWLLNRLRPLVGLPAPQSDRDENFSAWLRFLEGIARRSPTVLVVEDVHWASDSTLAFFGHVVRKAADAPLLVVGTARPEFLEAHPCIAGYADNLTRMDLKALSAEESVRLAGQLPAAARRPELASAVAECCGGNPLFAEELSLYLSESPSDGTGGGDTVPSPAEMPETIGALVAARLDALSADQRAILANAAIVGQVFWPGALRALSGDSPGEIDDVLGQLEAREFVRRRAESVVAGEREFTFWHAITRDVAYDQIPRRLRATRHRAVAEWGDTAGKGARDDLAGLRAHHYATALSLATAAGDARLAAEITEPTAAALNHAGDVAIAFDVESAERWYSEALRLTPEGSPRRPRLLGDWGSALTQRGRFEEADEVLKRAVALLLGAGDDVGAAFALVARAQALRFLGGDGWPLVEKALALVDTTVPSKDTVDLLVQCGRELITSKRDPAMNVHRETVSVMRRAIAMASGIGLPLPPVALTLCGYSECFLGGPEGRDHCEQAVVAAHEQGLEVQAAYAETCLALVTESFLGPKAAAAYHTSGIRTAESHGQGEMALGARALLAECLARAGQWDEALDVAGGLVAELEIAHDPLDLLRARGVIVRVRTLRGEAGVDDADVGWLLTTCRTMPRGMEESAVVAVAWAHAQAGSLDVAARLIGEWTALPTPPDMAGEGDAMPEAARIAVAAGVPDLATRLLERTSVHTPLVRNSGVSIEALLAAVHGELGSAASKYADAAERWRAFGVPYEEAQALLGLAQTAAAIGRDGEAREAADSAFSIFSNLKARPLMKLAESIRAAVG